MLADMSPLALRSVVECLSDQQIFVQFTTETFTTKPEVESDSQELIIIIIITTLVLIGIM